MVELQSVKKDLSIVFALLVRHHSIQDWLFNPFEGRSHVNKFLKVQFIR